MHTITTQAGAVTLTAGPGFVTLNGGRLSIPEARDLADALHFSAKQAATKRDTATAAARLIAEGRRTFGEV